MLTTARTRQDNIPEAEFIQADVTTVEGCKNIAQAATDRLGGVDILVHVVGGSSAPAGGFAALDDSEWQREFDLNLFPAVRLDRLLVPGMIEQGSGSIINVASMLGLVASTPVKQASYCASKGAVVNLTRELAAQWARKGVRVNALAPGWFPSEMTAEMVVDESSIAFVQRTCPMGRFGDPAELDGALLFLASDASSYCTGQTIAIDGGWTAR